MWFQQLFGDQKQFAIRVELLDDPHPRKGLPDLTLASWGRLAIWVNGRCLTQSVQSGTAHEAVEWYLDRFFGWSREQAAPLFNEEPLPAPTKRDHIASAVDWFRASEEPPWTLRDAEEEHWFTQRSDWRRRHCFRHAFPDAAFPNIYMRRLGDFIEFSWDNDNWPASRPDLRFTEQTGVAHVGATRVEAVWLESLRVVGDAISRRTGQPAHGLPQIASESSWEWLIPRHAVEILRRNQRFEKVVTRLTDHATRARLAVPHSIETLMLRDCRTVADADIEGLLGLRPTPGRLGQELEALRQPRPAPTQRPWMDGYAAALDVRHRLGWGNAPAPDDLRGWLESRDVDVRSARRSSELDSLLIARRDHRPLIEVNPEGRRSKTLSSKMMEAAALGVLLLDTEPDRDFGLVFSSTAHWPMTARAKAFAAMLLMPEDGVRSFLEDREVWTIDAEVTRDIMIHFGTTVEATTYHLKNLAIIDDLERTALVASLKTA